MTREEAIKKLKEIDIRDALQEDYDALHMAIEALEQEPFNIDTYCEEHFCFIVDKDLWEKAEKALKQEPKTGHWIPVSERLPEESGKYLVKPSDGVLEDYSDFSEVMIMPYDADCEAFGWWSEVYDPVTLGYVDSNFDEFEVVAWMPLPEPYKAESEEEDADSN